MKKIFYTDLDGTLLVNKPKLHAPEICVNEAKKWIESGSYFSVATGRNYSEIFNHITNIEVNLPMVLCNGALVYEKHTDRIIYENILLSEFVEEVILYTKTNKLSVACFSTSHGTIILESTDKKLLKEVNFPYILMSEQELRRSRLYKMCFYTQEDKYNEMLKDVRNFKTIHNMSIQPSGVNFIDVVNQGVSKAVGIKEAIKAHNINDYHLYAIGDQLNDIDMLKHANTSFAPLNATKEVLEIVDHVVKKHEEYAVYEAFKLIEEKLKTN